MQRQYFFWIIVFLMTVSNLMDIISTYYASPSLEYEANKWVKLLSLDFKGLVIVLIINQLLNTIPLWFFSFKYPIPKYQYRRNNSFAECFKIYFGGRLKEKNTWNKFKNILTGLLGFWGFLLPISYIISGIIVAAGNFSIGYFFRHVSVTNKTGILADVSFDQTLTFWSSLEGRFLLFYMGCTPEQKQTIQNIPFNCITILLIAFYIWQNYLKAIRTPMTEISDNTNSNEVSTWVLLVSLAVSIFILT